MRNNVNSGTSNALSASSSSCEWVDLYPTLGLFFLALTAWHEWVSQWSRLRRSKKLDRGVWLLRVVKTVLKAKPSTMVLGRLFCDVFAVKSNPARDGIIVFLAKYSIVGSNSILCFCKIYCRWTGNIPRAQNNEKWTSFSKFTQFQIKKVRCAKMVQLHCSTIVYWRKDGPVSNILLCFACW